MKQQQKSQQHRLYRKIINARGVHPHAQNLKQRPSLARARHLEIDWVFLERSARRWWWWWTVARVTKELFFPTPLFGSTSTSSCFKSQQDYRRPVVVLVQLQPRGENICSTWLDHQSRLVGRRSRGASSFRKLTEESVQCRYADFFCILTLVIQFDTLCFFWLFFTHQELR